MSRDDRIRVVQFLNSTVRAGAEEVALSVARGLDPERFESYLVCPKPLLDAFGDDWRGNGIEALALTLTSPWQIAAASRFVAYLRSRRIDVLHAHMIRAAVVAVPLARLAGVPVRVHTCHGREAWRRGWLARRYWADRAIDVCASATIAVSESTRDYLIEDKGLDPHKVVVIRNGRSLNGFLRNLAREQELRSSLGIGPDELVAGVFGRLEDQKGHRYLFQAVPLILGSVPRLKILLVGDGSLRRQLEAQARSQHHDHCVIFTGYRGDWMDLMALSDVVVLPSLYEGMPLVPIEAAMLGKPVVATAVDGTREVVVDGLTGRLVPPGQPEPLARALIDLLADAEQRQRLGEAAQARARELFTLERQVCQTAVLYYRLLAVATPRFRWPTPTGELPRPQEPTGKGVDL